MAVGVLLLEFDDLCLSNLAKSGVVLGLLLRGGAALVEAAESAAPVPTSAVREAVLRELILLTSLPLLFAFALLLLLLLE